MISYGNKLRRIFGSERTILFNIHSFTPWHAMGIALAAKLNLPNKRQSKVELANEEIRIRGVDSILD